MQDDAVVVWVKYLPEDKEYPGSAAQESRPGSSKRLPLIKCHQESGGLSAHREYLGLWLVLAYTAILAHLRGSAMTIRSHDDEPRPD